MGHSSPAFKGIGSIAGRVDWYHNEGRRIDIADGSYAIEETLSGVTGTILGRHLARTDAVSALRSNARRLTRGVVPPARYPTSRWRGLYILRLTVVR